MNLERLTLLLHKSKGKRRLLMFFLELSIRTEKWNTHKEEYDSKFLPISDHTEKLNTYFDKRILKKERIFEVTLLSKKRIAKI